MGREPATRESEAKCFAKALQNMKMAAFAPLAIVCSAPSIGAFELGLVCVKLVVSPLPTDPLRAAASLVVRLVTST